MHLINAEGVRWLASQSPGSLPKWDTLIVDESHLFKTPGAERTKALKRILPLFRKRIILTGAPSPNSFLDLYTQVFILDGGNTLGRTVTAFRHEFCQRGGYMGYDWILRDRAGEEIKRRIKPLVFSLRADDHLQLPDKLINDVWVDLPLDAAKQYCRLERELFLALDNGSEVLADAQGHKYGLCRQLANGGVYESVEAEPVFRRSHHLHDEKITATARIVEELNGKPAIVVYQFNQDREWLKHRFGGAPVIDGRTTGRDADRILAKWNRRELPVLLAHPGPIAHGLNLQAGGRDLIWFGLTDNPALYLQVNARLHRQGVTGTVRIHRVLARKTVDEAIVMRLDQKGEVQLELFEALNRYRIVA